MAEQVDTPAVETEVTAPVVENTPVVSAPIEQTTGTETKPVEEAVVVIPESADAYEINIDGFDGDAFKTNNKEMFDSFHKAGMNNDQVTAVAQAYEQYTQVNIEALQEEWGGDFDVNVNLAGQAIKALGFDVADADSPTFAIKLAAAIGKQIQEDLPPQNTQQIGSESIQQLMMSEAYSNSSHPDHKSVAQQVDAYYAKQYVD